MDKINKKEKKEFQSPKLKLKSIFAIYTLINRFFWKNVLGPGIVFIFPLFVVIISFVINLNNPDTYYYFASNNNLFVPIAAIPICLFTMPQLLVEIKKSILLKKIAQARISALKYTLIMGSYFAFLSFFSVFLVEIYWLMFMNVHVHQFFNIRDAGALVYSIVCLVFVSVSIGLIIGCTLKNTSPIPILGIAIIFVSFILSGVILSPAFLATVPFITYINLFSPLNYPLMLTNQIYYEFTTSTHNVFDITQSFNIIHSFEPYKNPSNFWQLLMDYLYPDERVAWYQIWDKILALFMPWVILLSFYGLSIKYFSWTSR